MKISHFLIFSFLLSGCLNSTQTETTGTSLPNSALINFDSVFVDSVYQMRKIEGCFVLYDQKNDTSFIYDAGRANKEFLPASTFKIPNSLIALECGIIKDENEVIPWDSIKRFVPAWNLDQNMNSAFRFSVVWFYQELARRIGEVRMEKYVKEFSYGNMKVGPEIDRFWLDGDLRITPMGQVEFLKKFITEKLPVKKDFIRKVKDIMIVDRSDHYILRAKTGWAIKGQAVGWYVGYLEIDGRTFIFVNNIDINFEEDVKQRAAIVKEILDRIFNIVLDI